MNPIFMLVGPPAVGKSTTSRALAAHFPMGLHIAVDNIRDMVVSGLELPRPVWNEALQQQITLARDTVSHMALNYWRAGFAVVIDDFWSASYHADYEGLFRQAQVHRIILYPDQQEAHQRNFKRSGESPARGYIDEGIRTVYQELNPILAQLQQAGWQVVDTTHLDIEASVKAILDKATGN